MKKIEVVPNTVDTTEKKITESETRFGKRKHARRSKRGRRR